MKQITFAVLPEKGHINPYIGPAQALMELGHSVRFVAPRDISDQLTLAGIGFDCIPSTPKDVPMSGKALVSQLNNNEWMHNWVKSLILSVSDSEIDWIRDYLPSTTTAVIVVDPLYSAAVIAAEMSGVAWVSMSNSLNPVLNDEVESALLRTTQQISVERDLMFARHGVKVMFRGCDALSPHLTIAFTTKELVGNPQDNTKLVGPSMPLSNRGDEPEVPFQSSAQRPVVYASFGSQIYYWPQIFDTLIEACAELDVHLVLSVGELYEDYRKRASFDRLSVFRYAPQLEILKAASLFISHGGANSVMEAIVEGVPLILSPMCNDQFHQSYFVNRAEIGVVTNLQTADATELRQIIANSLTNNSIRERMNRVSASYQIDGARESARLIAELL